MSDKTEVNSENKEAGVAQTAASPLPEAKDAGVPFASGSIAAFVQQLLDQEKAKEMENQIVEGGALPVIEVEELDIEDVAITSTPQQAAPTASVAADPTEAELEEVKKQESAFFQYKLMLMVLKRARERDLLDDHFENVWQQTEKNPDSMAAEFLSETQAEQVKKTYPEIWKEVDDQITEVSQSVDWRKGIAEASEQDFEQFEQLGNDVHYRIAVTEAFERDYPSDGPSLADRIKAAAPAPGKVIGLGMAIATGTVLTYGAVLGVKALYGKIKENPSVQEEAARIAGKCSEFLKERGVPVEEIKKSFESLKEKTSPIWQSKAFKIGLGVAGAMVVGSAVGSIGLDNLIPSAETIKSIPNSTMTLAQDAVILYENRDEVLGVAKEWASEKLNSSVSYIAEGEYLHTALNYVGEKIGSAFNIENYQPQEGLPTIGLPGVPNSAIASNDIPDLDDMAHAGNTRDAFAEGVVPTVLDVPALDSGVTTAAPSQPEATGNIEAKQPEPEQALPVDAAAPAEAAPAEVAATGASTHYEVVKGDSLSLIAKRELIAAGIEPTNANIDKLWRAMYADPENAAVIGSNPDKIYPGQQIKSPSETLAKVFPEAVNKEVVSPNIIDKGLTTVHKPAPIAGPGVPMSGFSVEVIDKGSSFAEDEAFAASGINEAIKAGVEPSQPSQACKPGLSAIEAVKKMSAENPLGSIEEAEKFVRERIENQKLNSEGPSLG